MILTVGQLKLTGSLGRGLPLVNTMVFWDVPVGAVWPPVAAQVPPEEALLSTKDRKVTNIIYKLPINACQPKGWCGPTTTFCSNVFYCANNL
jgi:hypothetical protein